MERILTSILTSSLAIRDMIRKQHQFQEAYERIDSAISSGFNIEAIVILENIMSGTIFNFLVSIEAIDKNISNRRNFNQLIELWKAATHPGSKWEECSDLIASVNKWRKSRNDCVHGAVKFLNNKATVVSEGEFLEKAKKVAADGKQLSIEVSQWRKRQTDIKRSHSRSSR